MNSVVLFACLLTTDKGSVEAAVERVAYFSKLNERLECGCQCFLLIQ